MKIKDIPHYVADLFFPKRCVFCDKVLNYGTSNNNQYFCSDCASKINFISEPFCNKCGAALDDSNEAYCHNCKEKYANKKSYYDYGLGLFRYNDTIKESIHRMKYSNRSEYADCYGFFLAKKFKKQILKMNIDAIIPIPIHKKRFLNRGYNQASLIARSLSNNLLKENIKIPVREDILFRVKDTKTQNKLDINDRIKNLSNAFLCKNNINIESICLIDDIYTTGATIESCAKALKEKNVKNIYFLSIAIVDSL